MSDSHIDENGVDWGPFGRISFYQSFRYALSIFPASFTLDEGELIAKVRLQIARLLLTTAVDAEKLRFEAEGQEHLALQTSLEFSNLRNSLEETASKIIADAKSGWQGARENDVVVFPSITRLLTSPLRAAEMASQALQRKPVIIDGNLVFFDHDFYALSEHEVKSPCKSAPKLETFWGAPYTASELSLANNAISQQALRFVRGKRPKEDDPWSFWREWYQGFLDGKPMDWELQRRVALIPDEDWEQGPEHIAEKIEEIRAAYLAEKVPLSERVELNEETGKFNVVPIPLQNQPLIGATLAQVSDALDDALENPANGLNDRSRETRVIRRTVERYGNDPQRIEMDFTTVHAGLTRQIARDELPASEENTALIEALREGAQSIRATHPEVAANREILNKQAFAELSDEQRQVLSDAQPILEDISEGTLKDDFAEDIPFLLEEKFLAPVAPELGVPDRNPVLAGYSEAQRTISRAAKIMIFLKKYPDLVKAIEENSAYKTASIVVRLGGLIAIGLALFQ